MDGVTGFSSPQQEIDAKGSVKQAGLFSFLQAFTLEIIIVFVGFNIIILVLNYFNIVPVSQKFPKYFTFLPHQSPISTTQPKLSELTTIPTPTINPKLVELPIALDKPQIRNVFANYILTDFIGEINQVENGVSLQFRDKSSPPFLIGPKTEVVREEGEKLTPIKPKDFKVGDNIRVNASFDLVKKTWNTNRVILLPQ